MPGVCVSPRRVLGRVGRVRWSAVVVSFRPPGLDEVTPPLSTDTVTGGRVRWVKYDVSCWYRSYTSDDCTSQFRSHPSSSRPVPGVLDQVPHPTRSVPRGRQLFWVSDPGGRGGPRT